MKDPDERRAEIVGAARKLFLQEGFSRATVNAIVRSIGVAQGTFYYYFSSKEEALDAVVDDYVGDLALAFDVIADNSLLNPQAALERLVRTEVGFDAKRARELYSITGADIHTRLFSRITASLGPRYQALLERGIASGKFSTPCPDLIAETIILHVHFLFDRDVLGWSQAEYQRRLEASARLIEVLLVLPPGSLDFSN